MIIYNGEIRNHVRDWILFQTVSRRERQYFYCHKGLLRALFYDKLLFTFQGSHILCNVEWNSGWIIKNLILKQAIQIQNKEYRRMWWRKGIVLNIFDRNSYDWFFISTKQISISLIIFINKLQISSTNINQSTTILITYKTCYLCKVESDKLWVKQSDKFISWKHRLIIKKSAKVLKGSTTSTNFKTLSSTFYHRFKQNLLDISTYL